MNGSGALRTGNVPEVRVRSRSGISRRVKGPASWATGKGPNGVIEGVDRFEPELQRLAFGDVEVLVQTKIGVEELRAGYVTHRTGSEMPLAESINCRVRDAR